MQGFFKNLEISRFMENHIGFVEELVKGEDRSEATQGQTSITDQFVAENTRTSKMSITFSLCSAYMKRTGSSTLVPGCWERQKHNGEYLFIINKHYRSDLHCLRISS